MEMAGPGGSTSSRNPIGSPDIFRWLLQYNFTDVVCNPKFPTPAGNYVGRIFFHTSQTLGIGRKPSESGGVECMKRRSARENGLSHVTV